MNQRYALAGLDSGPAGADIDYGDFFVIGELFVSGGKAEAI
jgi:hypothetical protein